MSGQSPNWQPAESRRTTHVKALWLLGAGVTLAAVLLARLCFVRVATCRTHEYSIRNGSPF